jgi:hypothetical protein
VLTAPKVRARQRQKATSCSVNRIVTPSDGNSQGHMGDALNQLSLGHARSPAQPPLDYESGSSVSIPLAFGRPERLLDKPDELVAWARTKGLSPAPPFPTVIGAGGLA